MAYLHSSGYMAHINHVAIILLDGVYCRTLDFPTNLHRVHPTDREFRGPSQSISHSDVMLPPFVLCCVVVWHLGLKDVLLTLPLVLLLVNGSAPLKANHKL